MISLIIIGLVLLFVVFLLNFYRDPVRIAPPKSVCVAPADGKIMSVVPISQFEHVIRKGIMGKVKANIQRLDKGGKAISIFMSPLDVHVNRMPMDGTIVSVTHVRGPFGMAFHRERSWQNEHTHIVIQTDYGTVHLYQIAGFLARRIQTWVKPGQRVTKGERIGRIVLGSQVTIILPPTLTIAVTENQRVYAGQTIIAEETHAK